MFVFQVVFGKIMDSSQWLSLTILRVWIYLISNHIPASHLSTIFFFSSVFGGECDSTARGWCNFPLNCNSQLQLHPSISIATSFFLQSFTYCGAIHIQSIFFPEALVEVVAESLFCFVFLLEVPKYRVCWTTSSVYTILMTLHSCHFIYAFELFKSEAPGWKQSEVAAWVFLQIKVMCLVLQLNPHRFLPEYLAQGCSAGFGFVKHLLRKSADYQRPQEHSSPFKLAFENVGLTPAQHCDPLPQSPLNANFNQCHFLINQSL